MDCNWELLPFLVPCQSPPLQKRRGVERVNQSMREHNAPSPRARGRRGVPLGRGRPYRIDEESGGDGAVDRGVQFVSAAARQRALMVGVCAQLVPVQYRTRSVNAWKYA